ncbi:MAG: hypothetical protein Q8K86_09500, partial [Candidatus Nanopelagicaceae bacterium]|nr:hypothetical protein [Candidatus Nanopelagicaceae bacterium]
TWYCLLPTMGCGYAAYHILSFAYWQEHVDALNAALDEVVIRFDEAKKADDMERAKTLQEEHKRLLDLLKKAIGWKERA